MTEPALIHSHVERDEATDLLVRDVMVRRPKTLPADATVADLRAMFASPRMQCALLMDGGRFVAAVAPAELPETAAAAEPARAYARADIPTLGPDAPMTEAIALLEARGEVRLVVVEDGELAGLLCLDRERTTFCTFTPAPGAPPQAP
jgi:predicted transcriptional regulator